MKLLAALAFATILCFSEATVRNLQVADPILEILPDGTTRPANIRFLRSSVFNTRKWTRYTTCVS